MTAASFPIGSHSHRRGVRSRIAQTFRTFIAIHAAMLTLCIAQAATAPNSSAASALLPRPNILCLVSEDTSPLLGCYGDPIANTPTIDQLAQRGIVFDRCFTQPVCAPSRFGLITGVHPISCGSAQHMRAAGKLPPSIEGFPAYLKRAGYYTSNRAKTDYNSPLPLRDLWHDSSNRAHWTNRIDAHQPFFAVFNHEVCHESCLFPTNEIDLPFPATDPAQIRIPAYQPDTPEIRADWARQYNRIGAMDRQLAARLRELEHAGVADNTIVFYYGDNGGITPRSKRFLHRSGIHVPLIVVFPPRWQHLAPAAPGSRIAAPVSFLDLAPTFLALAQIEPPPHLQGRSLLLPTRATSRRFILCSRDRMDERHDMSRALTDGQWLYIRNFRPDVPYVEPLEYMFRARGYQSWARLAASGALSNATLQFWGEKPAEELYRLDLDPDNRTNLVRHAQTAPTLRTFRRELEQSLVRHHDNGLLPEGAPQEGYTESRSPGAFPVRDVFQIARRASDRNPQNLRHFRTGLKSPHESIRWWAAQGCALLGPAARPATGDLERSLQDPSGAVQVAAAEALFALGLTDPARTTLEHWINHPQPGFDSLRAATVVSRVGSFAATPSLPTLRTALARVANENAQGDPKQYLRRILERTIAELEHRENPLVYPTPLSHSRTPPHP